MIISAVCQSSAKSSNTDQKSTKTAEVKVDSEYTLPEDSTTTLRDNELVLKKVKPDDYKQRRQSSIII
ncbi:hypothetical protein ACEQPO_01435 [Bacillus sp. SL00103]